MDPAVDSGLPDVAAAYDAVANAYSEAFGNELDHKPLDRALLATFAELTATGTVCDAGCGPGHVTEYLVRRCANAHVTSWFGKSIELDGYFLDPDTVAAEIEAAGFTVHARLRRAAMVGAEYPSCRCYLLARRLDGAGEPTHAVMSQNGPPVGS